MLLDISLGNALAAAVLALLAAGVGRLCRRPALMHGLWLLVLLKLVTPPLWMRPVAWPGEPELRDRELPAPSVMMQAPSGGSPDSATTPADKAVSAKDHSPPATLSRQPVQDEGPVRSNLAAPAWRTHEPRPLE